MTEWNERQLEELVRKMGLERTPGQQKSPIHLSLYGPFWKPEPLLTKIMQLGAGWWTAMGYDETDRVSVVRYLLAKLLVDAGCDPAGQDRNGWNALVHLAAGGHPADPQVTDLFLSAGCRTDLDGCRRIGDMMKSRFGRILEEHAQWKESLQHIAEENGVAASACNLDWDR